MCSFFSLVSAGDGKALYFDAKKRKKIRGEGLDYEQDSHSSISSYYGYQREREDTLNKYEYNPFLGIFTINQKNNLIDDSGIIKEFCEQLDFKTIVPELNIHRVINPFKFFSTTEVTEKDLELLKKWASVYVLVWDVVGNSIWNSVGTSVWNSARDSVKESVEDSVWNIVMESVEDSLWDEIGDSVRAAARAYISSFFNLKRWRYIKHKKGNNPFQCCIDLWNRGLIPCFDGESWKLLGKDGKEIYKEIRKA